MGARVLVTGASGGLGSAVVAELERRNGQALRSGVDVIAASHGDLDVASRDAVMAGVLTLQPDVIVHSAAFTAVDLAESEADRAFAVNGLGTRHLQEAARAVDAHLAYVSTDYVFDGTATRAYLEWDETNPLSIYGRSKLAGEKECDPRSTVVRTSWVCGEVGNNFVKTVLRLAEQSDGPLRMVDDQRGSPTVAEDLATMLCTLALERRPGIFHVTNQGETSWCGLARAVLVAAGEDPGRAEPITTAQLQPPRAAIRPQNSVLDNAALRLSGLVLLRDWNDAVAALVTMLRA